LTAIGYLLFTNGMLGAADSSPESFADKRISDTSPAELGKRIYHEGILSDGTIITAIAHKDISLSGTRIICADCHRRSGFGSSEGGTLVPPVAGSILFNPRNENRRELYGQRSERPGSRPAYTGKSLAKAIREGITPSGRTLSELMPRYNISDKELTYLVAYLKSIDSSVAPGITDSIIHFATIVTPDVPVDQKNTMLTTLTTYIDDLNAGTRRETKRAKFSPWHKTWHYGSYRKWQLHVWQLQGNSESWPLQLREYYTQQPVFAVINGISSGQWQPIHDFCKDNTLPCVFPTTNLPVTSEEDFYSIYFSRGIALEAEAIAKHLSQIKTPVSVLQIHGDTPEEITAANTASDHLLKRGITDVRQLELASVQKQSTNELMESINTEKPTYLILWLSGNAISEIKSKLIKHNAFEQVFFSSSFPDSAIKSLPDQLLNNAYMLRQYSPPDTLSKNIFRAKSWASARNLQVSDDHVMANAYFAVTITADVIKHLRANLIRDFFIERMEHMVENTVFHSVYPHLSLGPGQRFASKGCYIVGPLGDIKKETLLTAKYDWVVP
jgi:hypothetical protein